MSALIDDFLELAKDAADLLLEACVDGIDSLSALFQQPILSELGYFGSIISMIAELAGDTITVTVLDVFSWVAATAAVLLSWDLTGNASIDFPTRGAPRLADSEMLIDRRTGILSIIAIVTTTIADLIDTGIAYAKVAVGVMVFFNFCALFAAFWYTLEGPGISGWAWAAFWMDVILMLFALICLLFAIKKTKPVFAPAATVVFTVVGFLQTGCGVRNMVVTGTKCGFVQAFEVTGPLFVNGLEFLTLAESFAPKLGKGAANFVAMAQLFEGMRTPKEGEDRRRITS